MEIIGYSANRSKEIADLFYESIHAIDSSLYSDEQKGAWAPRVIDYSQWERRLESKKPYIFIIKG